MKAILILTLFLFFNCETEKRDLNKFKKITIDKSLVDNDTIKLLSKYPELKLFNSEKVESTARTAYIVEEASNYDAFSYNRRSFYFENYKCKAAYSDDTINIWLNNDNGYFGNGILVKVFNDQF
ncbi:hypothetical protein [Chryseobacterium gregarium]|uniref:hypothetical protein n=1 Tax=Chryseobacterium gregarium TaxID=456299 RepID=UPI000428C63E|nr:hypothetical protein [Chryseobacterium gregarium]